MLKPQDIVLLLKLLANPKHLNWSQKQLAVHLCMSVSEVNAGLKRLTKSGLLSQSATQLWGVGSLGQTLPVKILPVIESCEELLIYGVKYFFPGELGEYNRGIATSYAAPIFKKLIAPGEDPIPVWPHAEGNQRGLTLEPLYPSVAKSITQYPDQDFYDLLALVDAIRQGRTRERNIAIKILREKLHHDKK